MRKTQNLMRGELIDESDWTLTEITPYDVDDPGTVTIITADGPWTGTSFQNSWIIRHYSSY